jgi:hypothetical protein
MISAALIVVLLAAAASLGSWLFSQWIGIRQRSSVTILMVGGIGLTLLVGSAALVIVTAPTWWQSFVPTIESPTTSAAPRTIGSPSENSAVSAQGVGSDPQLRLLRTSVERSFQDRDYARAIERGTEYLAKAPGDADLRLLVAQAMSLTGRYQDAEAQIDAAIAGKLASNDDVPVNWLRLKQNLASRQDQDVYGKQVAQDLQQNYPQLRAELSAEQDRLLVVSPSDTPPVAAPLPADGGLPVVSRLAGVDPLGKQWPATDCVTSTRSTAAAGGWFIDNECDRVVAVVFAWCRRADPSCNTNALRTQGWRYEPAGIVMTSSMQRPTRQRLSDDGPLVAATYALSAPGDAHRRIRYLACYLTAPDVLELLRGGDTEASDAEQRSRLQAALNSDECYERVAQWSQSGQRRGKSPDSLLRDGV